MLQKTADAKTLWMCVNMHTCMRERDVCMQSNLNKQAHIYFPICTIAQACGGFFFLLLRNKNAFFFFATGWVEVTTICF